MKFRVFISGWILILVFTFNNVSAQLFDHLKLDSLGSINWKSFDYSQLKPFEKLLIDKDIIVLSEMNHGDGSSHDVQCMILKGLIDSSKINTIYTESSWMIIDKINQILKEENTNGIKKCVKYMQSSELRYWADNGFWDYLANMIIAKKVVLKGFDVGASELVVSELLQEAVLMKTVQDYKLNNLKRYQDAFKYYKDFNGLGVQTDLYEEGYLDQLSFIQPILDGYKQKGDIYRIRQWQGILNYFYWMYKRSLLLVNNKYVNVVENDKQFSGFMSIRDSLMADHFLSIYDSLINTKSIMLVSCYHGIRNSDSVEGLNACCKEPSVYIMADIINKRLGNKIYNIGFINATGYNGITYYYERLRKKKYPKPKKESLEYYLFKKTTGHYYFIDLQSEVIDNKVFWMRGVYGYFFRSRWSNNFSGLFYIREMKPLVFLNPSALQ